MSLAEMGCSMKDPARKRPLFHTHGIGGLFCVMKTNKHPFKTFEQQLQGLYKKGGKGLIITDKEFALEAIKSHSYYTIINGYKDLFIDQTATTEEKFVEGTTFSMLYQVYWMDLTMSNILFKYSLVVEKKLKNILSYNVAKNFSDNEDKYMNEKNYSLEKQKGKYNALIKNIEEAKTKDNSCIYYKDNEENIPPWIIVKGISFGSTFLWYSILYKRHKLEVIKDFFNRYPLKDDDTLVFFKTILEQVYEFRNLSAHGNRTFHFSLEKNIPIRMLQSLQLIEIFETDDHGYLPRNNLFSIMFSILFLISDKYVAQNFIFDLNAFLSMYSQSAFSFPNADVFKLFDLPRNTVDRLQKLFELKFM